MGMTLNRLEREMPAAELIEHLAEMNLYAADMEEATRRAQQKQRRRGR